ncbi:L-alanine-DL-glutamate epimerase-like enolase superfamily enzyme [Mesobacillus stamsii]|uniref:L-alanine-DL-glutamate epimerase-like enolase superfamily enzyme n=1 Tax=Mesobacillus stamsii TaxID=225347 RepID=A0ABU0FTF9_9BACI|nr:L-alanine-DL-glutamate epimerase-like enolase superfamily enzyme [Mesobacillus stamsii]
MIQVPDRPGICFELNRQRIKEVTVLEERFQL